MKKFSNKNIKFSLLCPTRGRLNLLENLIQSLIETTNNKDDVELLLLVDNDDLDTQYYLKDKYYPFNIKIFTRNRSEYLNRDYYNWLVYFTEGEYIWAIGNDVVFKIKDWDVIIYEKIDDYLKDKPDRIACIGIRDNTPKPIPSQPNYPCFPLITREAFDTINILLHPEIKGWGADQALHNLYVRIGRYFPIFDKIYLEHISYHTKMMEEDEISDRIKYISEHTIRPPFIMADIIPAQAEKLKMKMMSYNFK